MSGEIEKLRKATDALLEAALEICEHMDDMGLIDGVDIVPLRDACRLTVSVTAEIDLPVPLRALSSKEGM